MTRYQLRLALVIPGFQANEEDWCIPAFTNLARELARSVDLHVFTLRYPHFHASYRVGRVHVHAIGGGAFGGKRLVGASLLRLWFQTYQAVTLQHRKRPVDAIIGVWATESGWLATRIARSLGVPSLVHLAGGELTWIAQIRYGVRPGTLPGFMVRQALQFANTITAPSSPLYSSAKRTDLVGCDRLRRWSLGVDTQMFGPSSSEPGEERPFTFLSVGSLIPVKGHDLLLRAFAQLPQRESVKLAFAGAGPLESELRNLADSLGLGGYVDFLGEVPHADLPDLYRTADAFVLGSWHEAQCMAALEAMACGLPWVSTAVGALADAPDQDSVRPTGFSVARRDPAKFAQAMRNMMALSIDQRRKMGQDAWLFVDAHYQLERQTAQLLELVGDLVTEVRPAKRKSRARN